MTDRQAHELHDPKPTSEPVCPGAAGEEPVPDVVIEPDQVDERHGCPRCGERRTDYLEWQDDERVKCQTCGHIYEP